MLKWKYIFLVGGLIELGIGFSDAMPNVFFYLGRPIGAILLGLALITQLLEKESALYDEQNRAANAAHKPVESPKAATSSKREAPGNPVLTPAHTH